MHEKFQEEIERQERRLGEGIFQPPTVRCLADVKRILVELDPRNALAQTIPLTSELTAEDEHGRNVTYKVTAEAQTQTKRSIVLRGFEFIKARLDLEERTRNEVQPIMVNNKPMAPMVRTALAARAWVDPLLERWFGATREGMRICWVVQEGKFLYDPFEHKLFKVKQEEVAQSKTQTER